MIPGLCRRFALNSLRYIIVVVLAGTCLLTTSRSSAQTSYYRHIFFDNGPRTSAYFYTSGKAVAPSTVEFQNGKLPLDSKIFLTPPNSIRLSWQSSAGGSWGAAVHVLEFRDRDVKVSLFVRFCARLEMPHRLGRRRLPRQPNCQQDADHGFSGSRTSRNWSA